MRDAATSRRERAVHGAYVGAARPSWRASGCAAGPLGGVPRVAQLFDVVDQAEELPLPVHLRAAAQREAREPLVVPEIGKDRLHRRKRRPYGARPAAVSRHRCIFRVKLSGRSGAGPSKNITRRVSVRPGVRRHCTRCAHGAPSRSAPRHVARRAADRGSADCAPASRSAHPGRACRCGR